MESPEATPPRPSGNATVVASMPHSDPSVDTYDTDDDEYALAQQEWRESVEELQQLALVLILPWLGKFLGRKTSYWRACIFSSPAPSSLSSQCMPAT